jgi:hypothetical protein
MHTCPGKDCTAQVDASMLACRGHWYQLPADLRTRIWRAYRSNPVEHRAAVREALAFWGSK